MTPPATDGLEGPRTIEVPPTALTQQGLHEAIGHVYDQLAVADAEGDDVVPEEVLDRLEELYVATGEDSVESLRLTYELEE